MFWKHWHWLKREITCIHRDVQRLLRLFALKKIDFIQTGGCPMNFSIVAGTTGTFTAVLTPSNGTFVGVPAWTCSDPSVVFTPSTDGLSATAAVPAANTASFDVSISAQSTDSTQGTNGLLTASHTIAVTAAPPPPPPALTGIDFVQSAG